MQHVWLYFINADNLGHHLRTHRGEKSNKCSATLHPFRQAIEGTFENTVEKNQPFFSADLPKWSNWFISANPDSEDLLKILSSDARVTLRSSSASTFAMILGHSE